MTKDLGSSSALPQSASERAKLETAPVALRDQMIAEMMKLVRPPPRKLERKPTIEELERILNSECKDDVTIEPDGSVAVRPSHTTVGEVADALLKLPSIAAADEMVVALVNLSNEVLGSLPLMEPLARREFGNTNYTILIQRAEEARAIIARMNTAPVTQGHVAPSDASDSIGTKP